MKEIITTLMLGLLFIGCNSTTSKQVDVTSKLQRELNPLVSQTELKQLVRGNNAFALSLFKKLDKADKNLFFSPISISHALMMTYEGAVGKTKEEMEDTLFIKLDDNSNVHKAFNKLDLSLNQSDDTYTFSIANSIWTSKDYSFEQNYLDTIMVNYGAGLKALDFANKPDQSRKTINSWVEDKTKEKIKDLIPKGAINSLTKLVLTNAVYFKGKWEHTFDAKKTKKDLFNNTKELEFMHQSEVFPYYEDENLQAIKLGYKGDKSSMIVLLPKQDKLPTFTQSYMENIYNDFKRYRVTLSLPKFKFTSGSISMSQTLKELGMKLAFDYNKADFSNLSKSKDLYISDVVHKAFIAVDEYGTQAAAATAVLISTTGIEDVQEKTMNVNRAFVYLIVDNKTGQILFLGHMKNP